jgi:hypothetical protein
MAGYEQAGMLLQLKIHTLEQGNLVVQEFINLVNSAKPRDSTGRILSMHSCINYDILAGPTPAAVLLQGTDGEVGHAISIFEGFIVESSYPYALPQTQECLDWCCSPAKFYKPQRVYILK